MEIGQLVIKTAGRDSGNFALIIDKIDDTFVLIDGNVRRKKCNIKHLEPLDTIVKIKEKTSSENVKKALEKEGIKILKKGDKRERKERPKKTKKKNVKKEATLKKETKKKVEGKKEEKKEVKEEKK